MCSTPSVVPDIIGEYHQKNNIQRTFLWGAFVQQACSSLVVVEHVL